MPTRRAIAAVMWFVLAFLVWNDRFDYGVRVSARTYLNDRALYLRGAAPRVEMASAMRAGIADSARAAALMALPAVALSVWLAATRWRRFDRTRQS